MMIRQIELAFEKKAHGVYIFSAGALEASDYEALRSLTRRDEGATAFGTQR